MPRPYPPEFHRRALDLVESGRTIRDVAVSLGIALLRELLIHSAATRGGRIISATSSSVSAHTAERSALMSATLRCTTQIEVLQLGNVQPVVTDLFLDYLDEAVLAHAAGPGYPRDCASCSSSGLDIEVKPRAQIVAEKGLLPPPRMGAPPPLSGQLRWHNWQV